MWHSWRSAVHGLRFAARAPSCACGGPYRSAVAGGRWSRWSPVRCWSSGASSPSVRPSCCSSTSCCCWRRWRTSSTNLEKRWRRRTAPWCESSTCWRSRQPSSIARQSTRQLPAPGPLSIGFDNVSFDYGDDETILRDIDLNIAPAAAQVGVVGRTGFGETTLSRAAAAAGRSDRRHARTGWRSDRRHPLEPPAPARRADPAGGRVVLGQGITTDELVTRRLYDAEPSDNRVGHRHVATGRSVDVGRGRHPPTVGTGGAGLSAGEAQLLALATRVPLREPDLVHARRGQQAAGSTRTAEERIENAVAQLMAGRTTVIIAHRVVEQ